MYIQCIIINRCVHPILGCKIENGQPGNGKVKGSCEEGLLCMENGDCAGKSNTEYFHLV